MPPCSPSSDVFACLQIESGEICFERAQCRDLLLALLVERQNASQARLPPICPRHKLAVSLLAAGGHDPSWHSLRWTELHRLLIQFSTI